MNAPSPPPFVIVWDHETPASDEPTPDECDGCGSHDVVYPYTTMGYLCCDCREDHRYGFEDIT